MSNNIETGFKICNECEGSGYGYVEVFEIGKGCGYTDFKKRTCLKCEGKGKISWLEEIFSRSNHE